MTAGGLRIVKIPTGVVACVMSAVLRRDHLAGSSRPWQVSVKQGGSITEMRRYMQVASLASPRGGNQVSRAPRLFIAIAGLGAAAAITAGLLGCSGGSVPGRSSGPAVTLVPGRLTSAQRTRLEQGISAPAISSQATVVAAEVRAQFISAGRSMLPAGSHVQISTATLRATSAGTATVDAVVSGSAAGRWRLLLIREGGRWLLIGTRKLP